MTNRALQSLFPTLVVALSAALILAAPAPGAAQHSLADGGPYDPAVPTPAAVLGYELGDRFTPHHDVARYLESVARASPRVRLDTVGRTFEGRELFLVVITSAANQARLGAIRENARRLADPRGVSTPELDRALAETPAIAWLGYTIHGGEASGVEAALATVYQLAAGEDEETRMVRDSVVVLIDPVQNPDGHERHVQDVLRNRGALGPDPYPGAMDHSGGWQGSRTSHYLFDLNRDWFIHSHPETRGRTRAFLEWWPQVAVDLHEMGSSSTYFFAPPMEPLNPNVEASIPRWWDIFAAGNAAALAAQGWGFYTGESFDEFYPGYGVSWPVLTGAIGMTYEQASSGGGAIRRDDGTILTLREAAAHHYATSLATLRTVAARRTERLADYLVFRRSATREREDSGFRTVILEPDAQGRSMALVEVLRSNAIEVGRLSEARQLSATAYGESRPSRVRIPSGAWIIDLAQPQGRLAKAILEPEAQLPPAFIEEELEARREGRPDRFYDITAWSLPFTFRVDAWWTDEPVAPVEPGQTTVPGSPPVRARYAYAFAPGPEASYRMLARLLADSIRVRHARHAFRVGDADYPGGAFLVPVQRNRDRDIHTRVRDLAAATGATVRAIDTALADGGTDLGSNSVEAIPIPRVALVGGTGVSSSSYGAAWYAFDQRLRYPVTRVELTDLVRVLNDFSMLVLPSAYGGGLDEALGETIRGWVRDGGTLITLDGSTAWVVDAGLVRLQEWEPDPDAGTDLPASVPGAIVRADVDPLSPLLAGVESTEIPVMLSGSRIFRAPPGTEPGQVPIRYARGDRLHLSGYLWPEVPDRAGGAPFLWTESLGRGRVIAFTSDPNFRALWRGLLPVFANAVFLGGTL